LNEILVMRNVKAFFQHDVPSDVYGDWTSMLITSTSYSFMGVFGVNPVDSDSLGCGNVKQDRLERVYSELEALCGRIAGELSRNVVRGEGNLDSLVVFVGEAPGVEEDRQRRPFVGTAGHILISALENIGWKRNEVFITNVVKCRPPHNRPPRKLEIQLFLPYLKRELEIIEPKVTCLLGATATSALAGKRLINVCGRTIRVDGQQYFSTYHPAAVIYNVALEKVFFEHITLLRRLVEGVISEA
jgi:uracil-DNA glycosylase family 4